MDVLDLKTLAAVAHSGGVTMAAQALNTVQSNVTARIRHLEAELGVTLFERHSRGMRLTRAGQRLLPYAQRVQGLLAEAEAVARGDESVGAALRIGSMETTAAVRLPQVLARWRQGHEGVAFALETGPTTALLRDVLEHRLDGAFVAGPVDIPELVSVPAFSEELVLVSPLSCTDDAAVARGLQGGGAVLMFRQGCSYRQRFLAWLAQRGWSACQVLEFGTLDGILGCVAAGVGVAMLPLSVVRQSALSAGVCTHALQGDTGVVHTLFVCHHTQAGLPLLQAFVEAIATADAPPQS